MESIAQMNLDAVGGLLVAVELSRLGTDTDVVVMVTWELTESGTIVFD
jgi:hypothetical protein